MDAFLVRPACSWTVKSKVAEPALVRSIIRVDVHVHLECVSLSKISATNIAMERLDVGVGENVFFEGSQNLERHAALIATMLPDVGVNVPKMCGHRWLCVISIRTLRTLVRLLAGMVSHVDLAQVDCEESAIAVFRQTRKWTFTGVMDSCMQD